MYKITQKHTIALILGSLLCFSDLVASCCGKKNKCFNSVIACSIAAGYLRVVGNTQIDNNLNVGGTISATGNISGGGTLVITGGITDNGPLVVSGDITGGGTITAAGNITSTGGSITAPAGNISSGGTITAGGNITSTGGNISAPAGVVSDANGSIGDLLTYGGWFNTASQVAGSGNLFLFPTATGTPNGIAINGGNNTFTVTRAGQYLMMYHVVYTAITLSAISLQQNANNVVGGTVVTGVTGAGNVFEASNAVFVNAAIGDQFRLEVSGAGTITTDVTGGPGLSAIAGASITFVRIHG